MKKTIITIITIVFFISGCVSTSLNLRPGKYSSYKDITVFTYDLERKYEVLGEISVKTIRPLIPISFSYLNNLLRKKAYKEYKDADAVINVKYDTMALAEGFLDLQTGKSAKGTVIKFVNNDKTPGF